VNLGSEELQQLLSELEAVLDDDAQVCHAVGRVTEFLPTGLV
jgi:hypothetical protein